MRIDQQPAYVLHARPYRETSLLLECLTREHGRLGVVARGVRGERARLRRAQLEPFQPLALGLLLRGEMATLTAVETVGAPQRLEGDAALAGLYLNELVVRLTGRQDPLARCSMPMPRRWPGWPRASRSAGACAASNATCCRPPVMACSCCTKPTPARRSKASWSRLLSFLTLRSCLGVFERDSGQSRVPRPPAMITPYSIVGRVYPLSVAAPTPRDSTPRD